MTHTTSFYVRSYELDMYNHVNNAVYLNYLENARIQFLRDVCIDFEALRKAGIGLVVVRICIDYRRPAYLNDMLDIKTTPTKKRRTSGVFRQEVYRGEELIAEAEVTWATVNAEGRPCPMPAGFDVPALNPEE